MGDDNTAEVLNILFSNTVSNLKIEGYSNCDTLANNIRDPVLKCIIKYRIHPSILAIGEVYNKNRRLPLAFSKIQRYNVLVSNFNDSIEKSNFPSMTIDQLAYSRIYLKSLRDAFFVNYSISWISFCQNTNVVFAKVTAHNIVY